MIAITPMPPTISAIDEMTTSAKNVALADLIPQLQERVLRQQVEVVRLVELQAVADAHHALDVGDARRACLTPSRGTSAIWIGRNGRARG